MEHERSDGNVRRQKGHSFSLDPSMSMGGTVAPWVLVKWMDVLRRFALT